MPVIIDVNVITHATLFPGMEQWMNGEPAVLLLAAIIYGMATVFRKRIKNQNKNESTV